MTLSHCFPFIRKKQKGNKEVCLAILGIDNAGKTTTTKSIKGESLEVAPTVGFSSIEFCIDNFNITMYDVGGGKNIRDIWINYFPEVYGLVYVVDSADVERLDEARTVLADVVQHEKIREKPILLLANKQDRESALDEGELISELKVESLVNEARCPCRLERCSATLGDGTKLDKGIKQGLRWLLSYVDLNWEELSGRVAADVEEAAAAAAKDRQERKERVRKAREERERLKQEAEEADGKKDGDDGGVDQLKELDSENQKEDQERLAPKERLSAAEPAVVNDRQESTVCPPLPIERQNSPLPTSESEPMALGRRGLAPLTPLTPLDPSDEQPSSHRTHKKKKKKRHGLRKNKLGPSGDENESEMRRTTSTPDLFVTQPVYTLDELEEQQASRSMTAKQLSRGLALAPNAEDENVVF